jgi:hypothetical protein
MHPDHMRLLTTASLAAAAAVGAKIAIVLALHAYAVLN